MMPRARRSRPISGPTTRGGCLRVSVPTQALEVAREDVASVAARRVPISRPNDEQVRIPATASRSPARCRSRPSRAQQRAARGVLVGGSGPTDRDEMVAGIPILGQLADAHRRRRLLVAPLRQARRRPERRPCRVGDACRLRGRSARRREVPDGPQGRRRQAHRGRRPQRRRARGACSRPPRTRRLPPSRCSPLRASAARDLILAQQAHLLDRSKIDGRREAGNASSCRRRFRRR